MASSDPPLGYEIHSFHINIGVGDNSIHLLVDVSKTDIKLQGRIVQAILIDGEEGHREYVANISSTVDRVKLEYEFRAEDGDEPKFDSIIVTRWDSGHCGGLIRLLQLGPVLYQLFETASRDTVMPPIEGLVIWTLDMEYIYGSGGEPELIRLYRD